DLAVGSPAEVAIPGLLQVRVRDLLKTTCRVEAAGEFVGERLIVDKVTCAGRADGLLVGAHRVEVAAFNSSELRADQRGAVVEIFRAVRRPGPELLLMRGQ